MFFTFHTQYQYLLRRCLHRADPSDWFSSRLVPPVGKHGRVHSRRLGRAWVADPRTTIHSHTYTSFFSVNMLSWSFSDASSRFICTLHRFEAEMSGFSLLHGLIFVCSIYALALAEKPGKWTKTRQMIGHKRARDWCLVVDDDFLLFVSRAAILSIVENAHAKVKMFQIRHLNSSTGKYSWFHCSVKV